MSWLRSSVVLVALSLLPAAPVSAGASASDATSSASSAPANLVGNGSFEAPVLAEGAFCYCSEDEVKPWRVVNDRAEKRLEIQRRNNGSPHHGDQFAELDADLSIAIEQTLATEPGALYLLQFAFSPTPGTTADDNILQVRWGGATVAAKLKGGAGGEGTTWTEHSYVVRAESEATVLSFRDLGTPDYYGTYIDDVRVTRARGGDTGARPAESMLEVLREQQGWAKQGGGTVGGAGGNVFVVNTSDDAGSLLREALTGDTPRWVLFELPDGAAIRLEESIDVGSHKTIDGRGDAVVIDTNTEIGKCGKKKDGAKKKGGDNKKDTDTKTTALKFEDGQQLVVLGVTFDDQFDKWTVDCEGSDAIQLTQAHHVWVHHNTFRRWADGAVDINRGDTSPSEYITASWNRFEEIKQAALWEVRFGSFHHNYCVTVGRRCPDAENADELGVEGSIHSFNNVIERWEDRSIHNVGGCASPTACTAGAQLWSHNEAFLGPCQGDGCPASPWPAATKVGKREAHESCLQFDGPYVTGTVDLLKTYCEISEAFRKGSLALATPGSMDQALADKVMGHAGVWPD